MKKLQTMSTLLGGVLIGGILLGSLSMATAEDINSKTNTISESVPFKAMGDFKGMGKMLSDNTIDKLVTDKVITQQKAEEIKAFTEKLEKERTELKEKMKDLSKEERQKLWKDRKQEVPIKADLFSQLVENKILTEKQAETIQTKLKENAQAAHKKELTEAVQGLVDSKTITKAQSDKIIKQFDAAMKEREAVFEKTKDMTPEERQQFMKDNKTDFTSPLDKLVKEGTITEDQAVKLKDALPHKGFKGPRGEFKGLRGEFKGHRGEFKGHKGFNEEVKNQ